MHNILRETENNENWVLAVAQRDDIIHNNNNNIYINQYWQLHIIMEEHHDHTLFAVSAAALRRFGQNMNEGLLGAELISWANLVVDDVNSAFDRGHEQQVVAVPHFKSLTDTFDQSRLPCKLLLNGLSAFYAIARGHDVNQRCSYDRLYHTMLHEFTLTAQRSVTTGIK